jgi:hypothetical protein
MSTVRPTDRWAVLLQMVVLGFHDSALRYRSHVRQRWYCDHWGAGGGGQERQARRGRREPAPPYRSREVNNQETVLKVPADDGRSSMMSELGGRDHANPALPFRSD